MTTETFDIAIVGAGIAGASLAFELAPHARVLVLEREAHPGMHSTGRSAAMFMESYGPPQVRALTRASRAFYEQPPTDFAQAPILTARGAWYVGWGDQQGLLTALEAELRATGTATGHISAEQALAEVPILRAEGLLPVLTEPDAMDLNVDALHQGYLRGLRRAGGELRCNAEVLAAQFAHEDGSTPGGWTLTLRDGALVRCRHLVNAAGAWADTLAQRAGARPLGIQPKRRSAFTFSPPQGTDARAWPAVSAVDESWYFKPDAGQLLGSPANADPVEAHDVVPEELDIALGIDAIQRDTLLQIRRPTRTWAGLRSFAPDGNLVIGFDTTQPALFWLAGQGGYGIQSAAGAAQLAASLLLGRNVPKHLLRQGVQADDLSPRRFATAG